MVVLQTCVSDTSIHSTHIYHHTEPPPDLPRGKAFDQIYIFRDVPPTIQTTVYTCHIHTVHVVPYLAGIENVFLSCGVGRAVESGVAGGCATEGGTDGYQGL